MKVMLVEDSTAMRGIIREMLKRLGYDEIVEAADGQQAWERLRQEPYDLLLTDWNMPNMSGLELLQRVREEPKLAPMPVVMLTTRNNKEDIISAMKAGIDNYITKPCKPSQLKDKIDKALRHAEQKKPQPAALRDPEQLIRGSRKYHPSQTGPYILCFEAPIDCHEMEQGREKDKVLARNYTAIAAVADLLDEEFPGLEVGYSIERDTKEFTRLVNEPNEPVGILMISARRPEGFSLARLTGFKHATDVPVFLVCDSIAALRPDQRDAVLKVGVEMVERRDLNAAKAEEIMRQYLVPPLASRPSGLQIRELVRGTGPRPVKGALVTVHYTGMLDDGAVFDSSYTRKQPFEFKLGGNIVIDGWDEGVSLMRLGGKAQLVIPPHLAYGPGGDGGVIPPGATLLFNVELVQLKNPPKKKKKEPENAEAGADQEKKA